MKKRIAFCPTMTPFADKISASVEGIEMVEMGSAAQVLSALRGGSVDGVLIGRYAKHAELDGETKREILKEGYTLVYKVKSGLPEDQLKDITVKSYLDDESLKDFIPLFKEIIRCDSLDECIKDGLDVPVIIDWKDYRDDFEMLIPMNNRGKLPQFRAPVLYYKDIDSDAVNSIRDCIG